MNPGRQSTEPAGRDWTPIGVYVSMVAVVALMVAAQMSHQYLGTDVYLHLAAIRELSANLFDPSNPLVSSLDPTYDYSPYTVGLGWLGSISGAEPLELLNIGAVVNALLLASGLWLFSREFSPYRWAPHFALLFSLTAWGFEPWRWSGYWSLNSIGAGLGYPSMFASGLALIALVGLSRYFSDQRTWVIVGFGAVGAVVAVTHTFTLLWFSVAALAIVTNQSWLVLRGTALGLGSASAVAVGLVLLWPYYPVLELWQEASKVAADHAALYQGVFLRTFLLLPGAAALALRLRRNRRDPLVWMFVGALTIYTVGYLTAHYGLGRIMPLVALSSHVALAGLVADWLASGD